MAYSHYLAFFASHKDPRAFARFVEDIERIVENAPDGSNLCGRTPEEKPLVSLDEVIIGSRNLTSPFSRFKVAADSRAPKHRFPMVVLNSQYQHPYDSVVCACILAFVHSFPASEATSDGRQEDWTLGIALYEFSTERPAPKIFLHGSSCK